MSKHTPSRTNLQSTFSIGDTVTGSYISLTGSTKFGDTSDDTHQFTGSIYADSIILSGGVSGVGTSGTVLDNQIARFDGTSGTIIQSSSIQIKDNGEIEWQDSGSAEILGTDPDGGSAIGSVIGSSVALSTAGAKLVSEQNNSVEKAYTDKDGQKTFCISPNNGATNEYYFTEIISIDSSSGNLYSSANNFPAGCQSYAVGCRVLTNFATASQFYLGISQSVGGFSTKWGSYINGTAGTTNSTSSMESGWIYYAAAAPIYVSASVRQGDLVTSGAIRIEGRYRTVDVPTS